jgi:hypothetical protein
MKDLWLMIDCRDYNNIFKYVPIFADSEAEVGRYIKNNIDKFYDTFVKLYYNDRVFGKIRKKIYSPENELYYKMKNDIDKKDDFLKFVKVVLSQFDDEAVVRQFWAFSEGYIGDYIIINKINRNSFIEV